MTSIKSVISVVAIVACMGISVPGCAAQSAGDNVQPTGKLAKRAGPRPVAPVVMDGLRIQAAPWARGCELGQNGGFIVAYDRQTGKQRWTLQIYSTDYDPARERDVQDVFITALHPGAGGLIVADELGRRFLVNLATRAVRPL